VRVILLENSGRIYTSNAYLVLGDWSGVSDVNTLVDVGRDPAIIESLQHAPTGVGKKAVDQVVLTHAHYDHVEMVGAISALYHPRVCAFDRGMEGLDRTLSGGDELKAGDRVFEVVHTPGHSSDSICLYCREEGVLFAGDTPLLINSTDGTYEEAFAVALEKICARNVRTIYFGHGAPLVADCNSRLQRSLEIVTKSLRRSCALLNTTRKVNCEVV
jgi:glyoxylase-like metal-dependent hydrolase (beta-lactamase superfamily II)